MQLRRYVEICVCTVALLLVLGFPSDALAYIGPGMGAGVVGVVLGIFGSIFLALFAIIWFPIKRLIKRLKGQKSASPEDNEADTTKGSTDSQ